MTSYNFKNPFLALLKNRKQISSKLSLKKTYHLVLDIKNSQLEYRPGDCAVIFPQNDPDTVQNCIQYLKSSAQDTYLDPRFKTSYSLEDFLTYKANLNKITSKLLKKCYLSLEDKNRKAKLSSIIENPEKLKDYLYNHHLIDVLQEFANPNLSSENILSELLPLIPRFYSVSSSGKAHPDEVHLTVSLLSYTAASGKKRYGVASYFLTQLAKPMATPIPLYIQPNRHFHLPNKNTDIIMISAGTGIAPFISFLEERKALKAPGRNWLFFGERKRAHDFFYEDFLKKLEKERFLQLTTAFSRDQKEKIYVQHRLLEHQKQIWDWLNNQACIYICGDARRMAKDVEEALKTIMIKQGSLTEKQAIDFLHKLREEKRYLKDVY